MSREIVNAAAVWLVAAIVFVLLGTNHPWVALLVVAISIAVISKMKSA
jgi:uncharacterized membrane protein YgaE (UPF0421/DUF939 family)